MTPCVLFVDDERQVTRSIERALMDEPFEIVTAESGVQALEILASRPVDVVVSDERMPGMPGGELLSRVRTLYPDTVRILLTGQASVDAAARAINDAQVFRFLQKPCRPSQLVEVLGLALANRSASRQDLERESERLDEWLMGASLHFQPIRSANLAGDFARAATLQGPGGESLEELATHLGRTEELDRRVLELANATLAQIDGVLFVKLRDPRRARRWLTTGPLARHADRIVLEIASRASPDELDADGAAMTALRGAGFRFAIDDIGQGVSGLRSLITLQPDFVKLGESVLRGADHETARRKVIEALLWLCRELGTALVCEGVETATEAAWLREIGCDLLQGPWPLTPGR